MISLLMFTINLMVRLTVLSLRLVYLGVKMSFDLSASLVRSMTRARR